MGGISVLIKEAERVPSADPEPAAISTLNFLDSTIVGNTFLSLLSHWNLCVFLQKPKGTQKLV